MPPNRYFWLILIVLLGGFMRLVGTKQLPPSLNWDETSLGYSAYSLLTTGRDEWSIPFPVVFRAFGDYKLPGYVYMTVPSVAIFGLTPTGVRLPSIIAGTVLILLAYLLVLRLTGRKSLSLFTALLVAVEPWSWFLSRIGLEANLACFLFTLGITLWLYRKYLPGLLFLALTVWTYNSYRLFVPLMVVSLLFVPTWRSRSRKFLAGLFLFFFLAAAAFIAPGSLARYRWVALVDTGVVNRINELRANSVLSDPFPRLIYNKITYSLFTITVNYFRHFSPDFLFVSGGSHYQFNIPDHGLLYLVNLPLFYLGLWILFKNYRRTANNYLPIIWLLLAPVPASLTRDAPHTLRFITALPIVMFITAYGAAELWRRFPRFFWGVWSLLLVVCLGNYLFTRLPSYTRQYSSAWQYGYQQAVTYTRSVYAQYDKIIITKYYGEPHIFWLFHWPIRSQVYTTDPKLNRYFKSDWYWVDGFDKFEFVDSWRLVDVATLPHPGQKYLIVASPVDIPPGTTLAQFNFLDGTPAFIIKEN